MSQSTSSILCLVLLVSRIEEKEVEMRKEYSALQSRYSELLRIKIDNCNRYASLNSQRTSDDPQSDHHSPTLMLKFAIEYQDDETIIHKSFKDSFSDKKTLTAPMNDIVKSDYVNELNLKEELDLRTNVDNQFSGAVPQNTQFSINEESCEHSVVAVDKSNEDDDVSLAEEFNELLIVKEVEFLIKENQDLTETKIALNVLKDDLITKLDEMTGEICMLREDLRTATTLKKQYQSKSQEFERRFNEVCELMKEKDQRLSEFTENDNANDPSTNVNCVKTKTIFTREEVSRILQEKNKYKEELLELQEKVRYHKFIIAQNSQKSKKGKLWNLFESFLGSATAFTTEAFIGSGNEMTVTQLHRNFSRHGSDEFSQSHGPHSPHHQPQNTVCRLPKVQNRVSNPLLVDFDQKSDFSSIELVPVELRYKQCYNFSDTSL